MIWQSWIRDPDILLCWFLYCLLRYDNNRSVHNICKWHTVHTAGLAVNYYLDWKYSTSIKNDPIYEKITNPSLSASYLPVVSILIAIGWQGLLLALHNWLRWRITKQEQIPGLGLSSTCSWAQAKKKGHPYTRIWAESLSQMFPFQRSASDRILLTYDLDCLTAIGIFCFGECKNAPGNKFATWRHMRISGAQSSIMKWSEGSAFLRGFKYQWGGRQFKRKVKSRCKRKTTSFWYWNYTENSMKEGLYHHQNNGESKGFILLWNNLCTRKVKTTFHEKEFLIWLWFEALWNILGTAASFQRCAVYLYLRCLDEEDSAQKGHAWVMLPFWAREPEEFHLYFNSTFSFSSFLLQT